MLCENGYHQAIINDIIHWMNQHPARTLDTTLIARRAGFSRWHMQRLFKQHTGITLGRYIRIVRLGHAAIDLMNTEYTVIDIAIQYGYESQQTFTRAMKCNMGLNPGAIKRMNSVARMKLLQKIERLIALASY